MARVGKSLRITDFLHPVTHKRSCRVSYKQVEIKERSRRTKHSSGFFAVRSEDNSVCYLCLSATGASENCEFWRQLPSQCGPDKGRSDSSHLRRKASGPREVAGH